MAAATTVGCLCSKSQGTNRGTATQRTCSVATSSSDRRSCARSSLTADSSSRARSCEASAAAAWAPSSSSSLSRALQKTVVTTHCFSTQTAGIWQRSLGAGGYSRQHTGALQMCEWRASVVWCEPSPAIPHHPSHRSAPAREESTSATSASRSAAAAASCLRREAASPSAVSRRSWAAASPASAVATAS